MKNWNFNGSLKENNKRVLTEAEGSVNMVSARKDPSVSFNNDNGTLKMILNIPAGGGGETESGVGRTYVTEDGESRGEYFNIYEAPEETDYIGNAWGYGSHAEGGSLWRSKVSQTPSYLEYDAQKIPYDIIARDTLFTAGSCVYIHTSAAIGLNSHAEGYQCIAAGDASHAEGYKTFADSSACGASHAEGYKTRATGEYSHAEGYNTVASGGASHVEGTNTKAIGWCSHAEGNYTTVEASCSHIEGRENIISASGCSSHVEGYNNNLKGVRNHIEGMNNTIISDYVKGVHIEGGSNTYYTGTYSHIEGHNNVADDSYYSHIEGESNRDYGSHNHIEGYSNECDDAKYCHIEGKNNSVGDFATETHIEGSYNGDNYQTKYFHIEGQYNNFSYCRGPAHIEGCHNELSMTSTIDNVHMENTHIQGKYAKIDETMFKAHPSTGDYKDFKYADIVGGGTSDSDRKNISTLDWDGNQTIAGELYIKNSSQPLIKCLTQSEYNNLATKNPYTLYLIKEA